MEKVFDQQSAHQVDPGYPYQPFFCEENIWQLCQHPQVKPLEAWAVFMFKPGGDVQLWCSRSGQAPNQPVFWDYHVVLLTYYREWQIWDPDSTLGIPTPAKRYLRRSFPPYLPPQSAPRFRLIPSEEYVANFASDRSHMRNAEGGWLAPPPSWPIIGAGRPSNLKQYLNGDIADLGLCLGFKALKAWLTQPPTG